MERQRTSLGTIVKLALVPLLLLGAAVAMWLDASSPAGWVETTATVSSVDRRLVRDDGKNVWEYRAHLTYVVDGHEYGWVEPWGTRRPREGARYAVVYDPANPASAHRPGQRWVAVPLAVLALAWLGAIAVFHIRERRQTAPPA